MAFEAAWLEGLFLYGEHLSVYYVVCVFITFLTLAFTWWFQRNDVILTGLKEFEDAVEQNASQECSEETEMKPVNAAEEMTDLFKESIRANMYNLVEDSNGTKPVKKGLTVILDKVQKNMSSDQLEQEREVERQQLENIFEMLKKQQEIDTIEELEDQMKLYRG